MITVDQFKKDAEKIFMQETSNEQMLTNLYIYLCEQIKKGEKTKVINTAILRNFVDMIDREECTWAWAAEQLNKISNK
jgi:hypothetical protein